MSQGFPEVTIQSSEVRAMSSSHVDQEFRLLIALPLNYATCDTTYPVLYVLDANLAFGIVTETARLLEAEQAIPQLIIVGITYPTDNELAQLVLRSRDYTPSVNDAWIRTWLEERAEYFDTPLEYKGTGGAGNFLQFIREELKPFIHSNYRVNPDDQAFIGGSLSGLFGLYTLFHAPDAFNRYIIGSPSIWWDDKVVITYEAEYAARKANLTARVFMSAGSLEEAENEPDPTAMVTNMNHLAKIMRDRDYAGLELKTHIFEGETHLSVIPATISRGLRGIFG